MEFFKYTGSGSVDIQSINASPLRGRLCYLSLFVLVLVTYHPQTVRVADAETIDGAHAAYVEGRFSEAAQLAKAVGTSEGYALAAKSLTIYGRYIAAADEKRLLFEQAMELANEAIQVDPNNSEAYLDLARAMGRHSHHISKFRAAKENYAKKTREAIENAVRIDPESASAYVSLGRWHVGIIARVGSIVARVTFGARKKEVVASFERAIELNPETKADYLDIAIGYEALDYKKYQEKVHDLLKRAIELPVTDAYDRIIHEEAVKYLKSLEVPD